MNTPLLGIRVMVTRPASQAEGTLGRLRELGAETISFPAIQIEPPLDSAQLNRALGSLTEFDWVVFTSANGVRSTTAAMRALGVPWEALSARKIAVIGPATSQALTESLRAPDVMPAQFVSEAISDSIADVTGSRFLLLRADNARPNLADDLRARGAIVDEVAAYRVVRSQAGSRLDESAAPDYIALTSAAATEHTLGRLTEAGLESWMRTASLVCIGPVTAAKVRELGLTADLVAREYTSDGLIDAIVDHVTQAVAHA